MVSSLSRVAEESDRSRSSQVAAKGWAAAAFAVAVLALVGSLALSLGMGLKACPLCFYQRTFVMGIVAVLGMGLLTGAEPSRLGLLAVPLAVGGLGVACFHVFLEITGRLECPVGLLDLGTAPQQSLGMFVVICGLLLLGAVRFASFPHLAAALGLGVLLAVASLIANPPMPEAPTAPYAKPPDICRPPARGS